MAAKSDRGSSGSETPSGAPVHKYDHLIGEQVLLCDMKVAVLILL